MKNFLLIVAAIGLAIIQPELIPVIGAAVVAKFIAKFLK